MILELCKGVHCVDLGESFPTHFYLQNLASIQPRTSPLKFARSSRAEPRGIGRQVHANPGEDDPGAHCCGLPHLWLLFKAAECSCVQKLESRLLLVEQMPGLRMHEQTDLVDLGTVHYTIRIFLIFHLFSDQTTH